MLQTHRPLPMKIAESLSASDSLSERTFSLYWLRARCSPAMAQFCSVATASSVLSVLGNLADTMPTRQTVADSSGSVVRPVGAKELDARAFGYPQQKACSHLYVTHDAARRR